MTAAKRCVVYSRTSTEEGLGQEFNSLDAQAEACEAYIKSQVGEGWRLTQTAYEDGGYSGGSMDRPAFQRLLADVKAKRVDIVVVYKVDRLTRSLADFAKIMEVLDAASASFVSVTQSFNTTTSMGRLTLNVLLSFAQFEREVTGERIRDKLAASKAKGMWMGGKPPFGYEAAGRTLAINEAEAERVRMIFKRFVQLGSVLELVEDLRHRRIVTKKWTTKNGLELGGNAMTRGGLYWMLANPIYRGMIRHRGKVYPGLHPAIVDEETWSAAAALLSKSDPRASPTTPTDLLLGKAFDDKGHAMGVSWGRKGSARYRYYVSQPALRGRSAEAGSLRRVSGTALEGATIREAAQFIDASWAPDGPLAQRVCAALKRIEVGARRLVLHFTETAIDPIGISATSYEVEHVDGLVRVICPIALAKPKNATSLIGRPGTAVPRRDRALIRAVAVARSWSERLDAGAPRSIKALASAERACIHYTAKLLPLAYLAPDLVDMILDGRQPPRLTLMALIAEPLPLSWNAQRERFASFN
ncbi:site-specific recombinase [alpha proteobacterium U9-1i]|nr:site-specific recombinase [alpha proteobacterium U9-1i]